MEVFFSENVLQNLEEERLLVPGKYAKLLGAYLIHGYRNDRAREHALHGFSRRLKTLARCIENIFEILPPGRDDPPTAEALSDVTINLQAFIFNVFGCVDNLAWIWICETNLTTGDGSSIPNEWVSLRKKNRLVRGSFSQNFQEYLEGLDEWLDYLENYRHAAAHRIPPYIPPYLVTEQKKVAYQELENRKTDALNRLALADYDRFSAEQEELGEFRPVMTHSFIEGARPVVFHPQLIADFNTIDGLAWELLEELGR